MVNLLYVTSEEAEIYPAVSHLKVAEIVPTFPQEPLLDLFSLAASHAIVRRPSQFPSSPIQMRAFRVRFPSFSREGPYILFKSVTFHSRPGRDPRSNPAFASTAVQRVSRFNGDPSGDRVHSGMDSGRPIGFPRETARLLTGGESLSGKLSERGPCCFSFAPPDKMGLRAT